MVWPLIPAEMSGWRTGMPEAWWRNIIPAASYMNQIGCAWSGWDNCANGTADNQFASSSPNALAIDSSGNIYVTDDGNNRVQKFSNSGTWLIPIGGGSGCAGVRTSATTCSTLNGNQLCGAGNAGSCTCSSGTTNGLFNLSNSGNDWPGVAVDINGNIWVSQPNNPKVQEIQQQRQLADNRHRCGSSNWHLRHLHLPLSKRIRAFMGVAFSNKAARLPSLLLELISLIVLFLRQLEQKIKSPARYAASRLFRSASC